MMRTAGALLMLLSALGCTRLTSRDAVEESLRSLPPPNVVLVVVDTLRADWTTPYGGPSEATPELARWAETGVVFENTIAQSSWTKISMASYLTSLWPRTHGIVRAVDGLSGEAVTLAEVFAAAGYATYAVQTNGWLDQSFGFHQGFDRYVFPHGGVKLPGAKPQLWAHAERVLQETSRILDAAREEEPFFLYVHLMDVHEYASPPEFKRFGADAAGEYRAAIRWVDDALGRLRGELERRGLASRSLLVVGADHGEAFGENGKMGHAKNVLSAVLRVPLVIRLPFPVEPVRVTSVVRNVDVAPTLLDLAGLQIPESFEGHSLLGLVTGDEPEQNRPAYAGLGDPLFLDATRQVSLLHGRWTFARDLGREAAQDVESDASGPAEFLFDRSVDPGENVNLAGIELDVARQERARLDGYLGAGGDTLAEAVRIDPGIAERLRAMGYLTSSPEADVP